MARTTTNFGYNISEGSDPVNPLVDIFPNWEQLDGDLKSVSNAAVGRATELLTGTVHALTRTDTDRDNFTFTATANFTAGDTFTLDGVQVSALTPDGQQLATGAYIIGSEVMVLVKGTLLTFILNPAKAPDADKLDGHDSNYFATAEDMTQAQSDISGLSDKVGSVVLTTTAPDLSGAVNELDGEIDEIMTNTFGSIIDIKDSLPYTTTTDGYFMFENRMSTSGSAQLLVNGAAMATVYASLMSNYGGTVLYVKKGCTLNVQNNNFNSNYAVHFRPYA